MSRTASPGLADHVPAPLARVLADYLLLAPAPWPGGDGLSLDDVLDDYPAAAAVGRVPPAAELCRRHPELAALIGEFFGHPG